MIPLGKCLSDGRQLAANRCAQFHYNPNLCSSFPALNFNYNTLPTTNHFSKLRLSPSPLFPRLFNNRTNFKR